MCTCTSLPANLCFLFYVISKGCNDPILDIFFPRRFVFSYAFQCRIQNFATAKTKGAMAKGVLEFENVYLYQPAREFMLYVLRDF